MERLTSKYWRNLDPWEMCGQDIPSMNGMNKSGKMSAFNDKCLIEAWNRRAGEEDKHEAM